MKPKMILQVSVLVAAAASLALSISLYFSGDADVDKLNGIYVGVWVPSILSLGAFLIAGRAVIFIIVFTGATLFGMATMKEIQDRDL
jgi:ABC-type transport system involved in cytochrome bd biosynthesis fused ATPase/permease subunit